MNKRALIVYATVHGHAESIARRIADGAADWQTEATVQEAADVDPAFLSRYDAVVVVASVHFGRHPRSISRFLRKNAAQLARLHTALISVSGDAADPATRPRAEQYVRDLFRTTGWTASEHHLAGGAVKFTHYNPLLRFVIRRSFAKKGMRLDAHRDYDYTDWEAVLRFARAFLTTHEVKVA